MINKGKDQKRNNFHMLIRQAQYPLVLSLRYTALLVEIMKQYDF
ncbi:hypothetical protein [Parageobacillus toebii]|nr:hypothetical protein [Parageobacillus toebii]